MFKRYASVFLSEYLGTFLLVGISFVSSVLVGGGESFTMGLGLMLLIYVFSNYSRAHLNPVVTVATFFSRKMSLKAALGYLAAQFLGALSVFPLANLLRNSYIDYQVLRNSTGGYEVDGLREQIVAQIPALANTFQTGSLGLVFGLEAVGAFMLVVAILVVSNSEKLKNYTGAVAGLALFVVTAFASQISGASFHPFRSLVPALFSGGEAWSQSWVYVLAPLTGALLATVVYWAFELLGKPSSKKSTASSAPKSAKKPARKSSRRSRK